MSQEKPITELLGQLKSFFAILFIIALVFIGGFFLSRHISSEKYDALLQQANASVEELSIEKNRTRTLNQALSENNQETQRLREIIVDYENRPEQIRYIVKTETILVGNEETTPELPEEYVFRFENGLPVSRFAPTEDGFQFNTFDITFNSITVISEDETALSLVAVSSFDPEIQYPINVTNEVIKVRETKLFEPHISVGIMASLDFQPVGGDLTASISVPLLHPNENLDFLAPKIAFNSNSFRLGADIVGYNVGTHIPILTDLWISGGVSAKIGNEAPSIDITIGSKF
jgi:outer membrane murein-binding lipoprotein Lpp